MQPRFTPCVRRGAQPRKTPGFTLIELMIALVVVAVLAAIALPAYQSQIRSARRSEAIVEVSKVQQAQERWRANNSSYSADVSSSTTGLRITSGTTVASDYDTSSGYYNIALSGNTGTAYIVTMGAKTGKSQVKDTNCQCMRVSWSNGNATYEAANSTSGSCGSVTWSTANAASCWKR